MLGFDINPMAAWIVREEIEHLDLVAYRQRQPSAACYPQSRDRRLYRTDCPRYGDKDVPVKYFLWVKVIDCAAAEARSIFSPATCSRTTRATRRMCWSAHPAASSTRSPTEEARRLHGVAPPVLDYGPAKRGHCACPTAATTTYIPADSGPPRHRLFAIEYFNPVRHGAT